MVSTIAIVTLLETLLDTELTAIAVCEASKPPTLANQNLFFEFQFENCVPEKGFLYQKSVQFLLSFEDMGGNSVMKETSMQNALVNMTADYILENKTKSLCKAS